jgi:hypothetical protein
VLYVDVIFALYHVPTGSLQPVLWFFPSWTETYEAVPVPLPPNFNLPMTKIMDVDVPSPMIGTPPVLESGEYIWAAALAKPNTLEFLTEISTAPVMIKDPTIPSN